MFRTRFRPTLYQHRFSMIECLFALLICVLFVGTSIPAVAAQLAAFGGTDSRTAPGLSSSRNAKTPRLVFVSPAFGAVESDSIVTIKLHLSHQLDRSTLKVKLNGYDISTRLHFGSCNGETCTMTGTVAAQQGLKNGQNLVSAFVSGVGHGPGDVRRSRFYYQEELGSAPPPPVYDVTNYEPVSVGISTVTPGGGTPWIQITTGSTMGVTDPVANFPVDTTHVGSTVSVPYTDIHFSTACTTPLQAVVLNREIPSTEETTACGANVSALETAINASLKSKLNRLLGPNDLVILGTTSGNNAPTKLDTTDFGGTNYSNKPVAAYPQKYMLIGVKGAPAGTAHESYDVVAGTDTPIQRAPVLNGTLMLDSNNYYNYIPSRDQSFSVVSGADTKSTGIAVGNNSYQPPTTTGNVGAFWLLVLDRQTLKPVTYPVNAANGEQWVSCQNNMGPSQVCGGIFPASADSTVVADLQTTLASISPRNLVFLVAAGCPFQNANQVSNLLGGDIYALGGVQYSLLKLTAGSNTCAYSLVSVNDGNHHDALTGNAALSANQYSAQLQTGALQGFLARDNSGLYDVAGKAQAGTDTSGAVANWVDSTFEQTASNQRVDWPLTDTPGLLAAYHDISYQLLTDRSVAITGPNEYDMRFFYTDASTATDLIAENQNGILTGLTEETWDTATPEEFNRAKTRLGNELTNLSAAMGYLTGSDDNGGIRGILTSLDTPILENMFAVASDISKDQAHASKVGVDAKAANLMNLAAGVASIGAVVFPPMSVALGIMSGALWAGSASEEIGGGSTIPGPENSYDVTLSTLVTNASKYSGNTLNGFDGAVDNIFTDSSKLTIIGKLTRNSASGWNIANLTDLGTFNNLLVSGATGSIWMDVIPNLYGTRLFFNKTSSDPSTFTYQTYDDGAPLCDSVYDKVPAASMTSYPTLGFINQYDVVILAEGTTISRNFTYYAKDTPVSSDLAEFLTTSNSVTMGGNAQTGLNITPDILFNNGPLLAIPGGQYSTQSCKADPGGAQGASFTLTPAPGAETIRRGDIGAFILQLKSVNGFKGNVRLSCSGGPPDSQCGDLPRTVKVNGTAYALSGIRFPAKTPPGTYTINFNGVSGAVTNTATAKFTVK